MAREVVWHDNANYDPAARSRRSSRGSFRTNWTRVGIAESGSIRRGLTRYWTRARPQLGDSQEYSCVIHERSADSELTDAPLRPSGRSMGQDQGYFARP